MTKRIQNFYWDYVDPNIDATTPRACWITKDFFGVRCGAIGTGATAHIHLAGSWKGGVGSYRFTPLLVRAYSKMLVAQLAETITFGGPEP